MELAVRIFRLLLIFCFIEALTLHALGTAIAQTIQSEKHNFRLVKLVKGLQNPWSMDFLPDGRILVTEREGRLRLVGKDFTLDPKPQWGLDLLLSFRPTPLTVFTDFLNPCINKPITPSLRSATFYLIVVPKISKKSIL